MSIGSAYIPGRYVSLVGSCMFHVLLCHLAEVIHAEAEIAAWPTWCFYVLNRRVSNSTFFSLFRKNSRLRTIFRLKARKKLNFNMGTSVFLFFIFHLSILIGSSLS